MTYVPDYIFDDEPALGSTIEVSPGVHWLRMPLPFKLNHINLWLLEDGDGWAIIDTGINREEVKEAWRTLFKGVMVGRPVTKVVVTHFHPDHVGLAGWLVDQFDVPFYMPLGEWTFGRMVSLDESDRTLDGYRKFYHKAGFDEEMLETVSARLGGYPKNVAPIPTMMNRLSDGNTISINGDVWEMVVGRGHSPEHACLYCQERGILISGDQVLPKISPNVSVWPQEPNGRPLALFLESLTRLRDRIPEEPMILPSHNWPFRGLHARLDDLAQHHEERLDETVACLDDELTGVQVLRHLFKRELDQHQMFFAIGETLAHLYHLVDQGRVAQHEDADGVFRFAKA